MLHNWYSSATPIPTIESRILRNEGLADLRAGDNLAKPRRKWEKFSCSNKNIKMGIELNRRKIGIGCELS